MVYVWYQNMAFIDVQLIQRLFYGRGGAAIALIAMRGATVEHREALRTEFCRCIVAVVAESATRDYKIWSSQPEGAIHKSDSTARLGRLVFSLTMFC